MTTGGDDEVVVELPHGPRAAATARGATREALGRWRLAAVLDDVLLAVSELVTNAVVHGAPRVWLVLRRCAARVEVAVHDGRPLSDGPMGGSQDGRADDSAESGRGLRIVRALTDDVHVEQVTGDGKIVHASFGTRA